MYRYRELYKIRFGGCVLFDRRAAQLISLEHAQRGSVDVYGDEVAAALVRVAELMNVGNLRSGETAGAQFAMRLVAQAGLFVVIKYRLPKNTLLHEYCAV